MHTYNSSAQEDEVCSTCEVNIDLCSEFWASQGYVMRPLKTNINVKGMCFESLLLNHLIKSSEVEQFRYLKSP